MDIEMVTAIVAEEERRSGRRAGVRAACALRPAREASPRQAGSVRPRKSAGLPAAPLPGLLFAACRTPSRYRPGAGIG